MQLILIITANTSSTARLLQTNTPNAPRSKCCRGGCLLLSSEIKINYKYQKKYQKTADACLMAAAAACLP